jgi:hypothetical protein
VIIIASTSTLNTTSHKKSSIKIGAAHEFMGVFIETNDEETMISR